MKSRLLTVAVRQDGTIVLRRWVEDVVIVEASLHGTTSHDLDLLLDRLREEIWGAYTELQRKGCR